MDLQKTKIQYVLKMPFVIATLALISVACQRNMNHLVPVGGYCGKATEAFENPYSMDNVDAEIFSTIESSDFADLRAFLENAALEKAKTDANTKGVPQEVAEVPAHRRYTAQNVSLLMIKDPAAPVPQENEKYVPDEQLMFVHNPVYSFGALSPDTFLKSCARGLTLESKLAFETTLPTEIILNEDMSWTATKAVGYNVEFNSDLAEQGYLVSKVADASEPSALDPDSFGFKKYIFLQQTGKLNKDQRKAQENPANSLSEIVLQIQVSDNIYARVTFVKVNEVTEGTPRNNTSL